MAGFVYFIPNESRTVNGADIKAHGLEHAFGNLGWIPRECHRGPGGKVGVTIVRKGSMPDHMVGYHPDKQTWRAVPQSAASVGFYNEDRPRPATLVRDRILQGHGVELGDGNVWEIPVARQCVEHEGTLSFPCRLPMQTDVDDQGRWVPTEVVGAYRALWDVAMRWWDAIGSATAEDAGGGAIKVTFTFDELHDAALLALATNYHVGKAEVAALCLFDSRRVRLVLDAVVDTPTLMKWLSKKNGMTVDG